MTISYLVNNVIIHNSYLFSTTSTPTTSTPHPTTSTRGCRTERGSTSPGALPWYMNSAFRHTHRGFGVGWLNKKAQNVERRKNQTFYPGPLVPGFPLGARVIPWCQGSPLVPGFSLGARVPPWCLGSRLVLSRPSLYAQWAVEL